MLDPNTRIGAVTLRVADIDKVTEFYRQVIGLAVLQTTDDEVRLGTGNQVLVRLLWVANGRFLTRTPGLYHLALRVPGRSDLGRWLRHYAGLQAPYWQGASDHGASEALYLSDPEGNGIEIYRDRPKERWPTRPDGKYDLYTRHLDLQSLMDDAQAEEWAGLPEGTDMGHVHLRVADLPLARHFYVALLGFNVMAELPGSALFVAAGDYHHHLGMNTWESRGAPPAPRDAYGLDTFEIVYPSETERESVVARLSGAGVSVDSRDDSPRVRDPFDNSVTLAVG